MKRWLRKIGILTDPGQKIPVNKFNLNEISGAVGDLGTLLPLAFALIVFNGYSVAIIFLGFGVVYIVSGWFYKVPVSVQPLKAMTVIAIAHGFSPEFLAVTSFFYGILFIFLALSGFIQWLQKIFTPTLVRGVQFGIGLILAKKSVELVLNKGFLLYHSNYHPFLNIGLFSLVVIVLWAVQFRKKFPIGLVLILLSVIVFGILGWGPQEEVGDKVKWLTFTVPNLSYLKDALILLMIPQLPLTLGNAVYAASDSCHTLWGKQAIRVNPSRLALSIGLSDTLIGLAGGFPICHGAGGMGAHAQFGARTGGATIILGSVLIVTALIPSVRNFIFLIPVPLLAAMLLFDSYRMMVLVQKVQEWVPMFIAILIGFISLFTKNLTVAILIGFILERIYYLFQPKIKLAEGVGND
jgi:SulP family sulfate permease